MHRFIVRGLDTSTPFISVDGKPITIWLKMPIAPAEAERAALLLSELVEDIEVEASESGTVRLG
jgi:hypothetical protein